eukprot:363956_1
MSIERGLNAYDIRIISDKIVSTFVRESQALLMVNNIRNNTIPKVVIEIISSYYNVYIPKVLLSKYSQYIKVQNELGTSIIITDDNDNGSVCLFGNEVNSKMCNKYDIHIKKTNGGCYIGYVTSINWTVITMISMNYSFGVGEVLLLSFNFAKNCIELQCKGKMIKKMSLNMNKTVLPSFSLYQKNDSLEIVKHELY